MQIIKRIILLQPGRLTEIQNVNELFDLKWLAKLWSLELDVTYSNTGAGLTNGSIIVVKFVHQSIGLLPKSR